jgi:hypothetical protein
MVFEFFQRKRELGSYSSIRASNIKIEFVEIQHEVLNGTEVLTVLSSGWIL